MRVLWWTPAYLPAFTQGGPLASQHGLCQALLRAGAEVRILTRKDCGAPVVGEAWENFESVPVWYSKTKGLWRWQLAFRAAIESSRWRPEVVHATGVFSPLLWIASNAAHRLHAPVVVSPRGSLLARALATKPLRKRVFLYLNRPTLYRVGAFHATSEAEAKDIGLLLPGARVTVIPNGVVVPVKRPSQRQPTPFLIFLGRVHPHKQVERIIASFSMALGGGAGAEFGPSYPREQEETATGGPWSLTVAGSCEATYRNDLERAAAEAGLSRRVRFVGHVEGDTKAQLLAEAQGLVLASRSENFGMVVAEALGHETPCVVTKTAPWEGLEREGCGFWVDDSVEALAGGMQRLMALTPEQRREMGARGRAWMQRDFSWESVGRRMLDLYEMLIKENKTKLGDESSRNQRVSR